MYPGVDLRVYKPSAIRRSSGAPRVLFATAPRTAEELEKRGVHLLLKAAEADPRVHYRLLFREWGTGYTSLAATKRWIQSRVLPNVNLTNGVVMDMPGIYRNFDFTVIPYTSVDGGKECPMSALEGLACGLPALVSSPAPFAEFVAENKCGVVFDPTPENLVAAIGIAVERYRELSNNAVNVAHRYFSAARLLERMSQIYSGILS
jgi:glycosyltransferase involved in cell wall biosynthesis